ncbi:MAG TPA: hypothetical protein PK906_09035 [Spirochaetota bacterium]|nr:hypothetical protein [Spirochaetota bacterium]
MARFCRHINLTIVLTALVITLPLKGEGPQFPEHIAYNIKTERIKFSNNSIKITWKMNSSFNGEFVVGRSEKEFNNAEDVLKSELIGVFYSGQDGLLIDRNLRQGRNYYYIVISKNHLLKRKFDILKNINCTSSPLYIFSEPGIVKDISAEMQKNKSIEIEWDNPGGSGLKFNLYRSRSVINATAELEVAEKLITTDDDEYTDKNISEYVSYFYAVTVTDKNGIEYFNPQPDKNFTTNGIYLKGKTLATPLNVGAYLSNNDSIIVKWEKATSRTGKELSGYEIYRSEEMINSLLKLKFARLMQIVNTDTIMYNDREPGPGKFYYAVFARYSDGTVDINFEDESSYTKAPVIITHPYRITALSSEVDESRIILRWNYSGNTGTETVGIFRKKMIPLNSRKIMSDDFIGTENIKSGRFIIPYPETGSHYYGVIIKSNDILTEIKPGINVTSGAILVKKDRESGKSEIIKKERPSGKGSLHYGITDRDLDNILKNLFYREQYHSASKELKKYIDGTDNDYNRAKARLFLARTYIELKEYRLSINILNSSDVKTNFPEEAKFWSEFAMVRLK